MLEHTGWWFGTFFYVSIYWELSSQLIHSFQRGRYTTNQYGTVYQRVLYIQLNLIKESSITIYCCFTPSARWSSLYSCLFDYLSRAWRTEIVRWTIPRCCLVCRCLRMGRGRARHDTFCLVLAFPVVLHVCYMFGNLFVWFASVTTYTVIAYCHVLSPCAICSQEY